MTSIRILQFDGTVTDAHPARLGEGMFAADVNGDRFQLRSWRTRRGMLRTTIPTQGNPVTTIAGFNVPGRGEALTVLVSIREGTLATSAGYEDVGTQGPTDTPDAGYGGGGYGEGGYGG